MGISVYLEVKLSTRQTKRKTWLVLSKRLVNPPEEKRQESNWQPRQLENLLQPLVELKSHTDIGLELSPFVRLEDTKNLQNSCSASCPSNVWCVKLLRTLRQICVSNQVPSWHCKKRRKLTSLAYLRIPTYAQSTPK